MKKHILLKIALFAIFAATLYSQTEYTKKDLVWSDDFKGSQLNTEFWNYEIHEPGWVNNELQEYVPSTDNVYVKNGKLVIQAIKTTKDGETYYTSGRVNTQNKFTFKYGRVEAKIKFPKGQGFLPAFWMMPNDENLYGQWPKCGEIDVAEVLGHKTDTAYGTVHYGEPHKEQQGSYQVSGKDFSDKYHVFACEWEPGEIRFYVDGKLYNVVNDWYSKRNGFGEVTYPAPFDQPFYIIFNLAVGGNWPGNPDETTNFGKDAQLLVDYVKVYQKKSYDENVKKPESKEITVKQADANGNYVTNGNFAVAENLSDSEDWGFLTAGTGVGSAEIKDNMLIINTENAGNLDYSIQVVQPNIPLYKGVTYQYSFDAEAADERTIITGISAPNAGWIRYFPDTKITVGPQKQHFVYEFVMKDASDPTGRIEFNLGNQPSTSQVRISNVDFRALTSPENVVEEKEVLPDGNYIYNGQFQEGENRLAHWNIKAENNNKVSVTNQNNIRELKIEVADNSKPVVVSQDKIKIFKNTEYLLSFDGYSSTSNTIKIKIANKEYDIPLSTQLETHKITFTPAQNIETEVALILQEVGNANIDNIRLQENTLLLNGAFSNGLTSWEVYANEGAKVDYAVDSLSEDNAFCMNIENTGTLDWMIQLKQNNVVLEKGKKYKIQFDAKSSLPRTIMYALQRDDSSDNNWIPYSGTIKIDVAKNFNHYELEFVMNEPTDTKVILSISMGAVNDIIITDKHTVTIDNIELQEIK